VELNLRKARKLESKIQKVVDSMDLKSSVRVRALATASERAVVLDAARLKFLADVETRDFLITIRFLIRKLIGHHNASSGINDLITEREELTELLAKNQSGVFVLDIAEAEDLANAKKTRLEAGKGAGYGDEGVTITLPVSYQSDLFLFEKRNSDIKKRLEDIEDLLAQKNLSSKITLGETAIQTLQSAGIL
jgi:hypothetical protein